MVGGREGCERVGLEEERGVRGWGWRKRRGVREVEEWGWRKGRGVRERSIIENCTDNVSHFFISVGRAFTQLGVLLVEYG